MDYARNPPWFRPAISCRLSPSSPPLKPYNRSHMQPALSACIPDGFMAAMRLGVEKPHQGVRSQNPAPNQVREVCNFTVLLGLRGQAELNRVGSRSTGKERDTESGNDYFGARYYASSMGRFMSPDFDGDDDDPEPVPYANLENPQSLNLYGYVLNNPLTGTDPTGHWCVFGHIGTTCTPDPCAGIPNCASVTAKPDPPPPVAPTFLDTYVFNRNAGLNTTLSLVANAAVLYSKAIQHTNPNGTKGVKPRKDKNGKIIGWSVPDKGPNKGKRKDKSLEWGKGEGLNPDDPQWNKVGVAAAEGAVGGLTIWTMLEYAAGAAL